MAGDLGGGGRLVGAREVETLGGGETTSVLRERVGGRGEGPREGTQSLV